MHNLVEYKLHRQSHSLSGYTSKINATDGLGMTNHPHL